MLAIRETTLASKLKRVFHADAVFYSISFHLLFLLSEIYYAGYSYCTCIGPYCFLHSRPNVDAIREQITNMWANTTMMCLLVKI